jgi:regulator of RNase E activity RraA
MDKERHLQFDLIVGKLYSDVISDVLDESGFCDQAMRCDIRPLFPETVLTGRASTSLAVDVYDDETDTLEGEMEAVDDLKKDDVAMMGTNRSTRAALWGELLSTAARARGSRGAVIDGFTRDVGRIVEMRFPVFAAGIRPVSSNRRCRVIEHNRPVECGGVLVNPGDIIFGDIDGVVVIPSGSAIEIIDRALEKVQRENVTRRELEKGALLRDVYRKYGTL